MYTDRNALKEYAYAGTFYKVDKQDSEDGSLLGDYSEQEIIILQTECDIQETNKLFNSGVITMGYTIFFPTPIDENGEENVPKELKAGVRFRGCVQGLDVDGMVIGIYPTQLHGCVAYIRGTDI